ncbi:hypothetical protein OS493_015260 [Desmophyllum pertusum]|uniref:Uncharacterized protein n=1 Tax=Desmophyllum pertusum TaxID=174260 RepID=A0A9W9ZDA8_9CNID|nr:hypothetical protein OS493_015260 [Desmophyllum pertusum]
MEILARYRLKIVETVVVQGSRNKNVKAKDVALTPAKETLFGVSFGKSKEPAQLSLKIAKAVATQGSPQ